MSHTIRSNSFQTSVLRSITCIISISQVAQSLTYPTIVTREGWKGRPPKLIEEMPNPVPYVVIHHSYFPPACNTSDECIAAMQWMQDFHQLSHGWNDIGYSFAVGGDGKVYEGRGWSRVGAHAPHYNNKSIGICVIGDWRNELPPENQLQTIHQLIEMGVSEGKIITDYNLVGHKDVRNGTECPGGKLYEDIQTWPHYFHVPNDTKENDHPVTEDDLNLNRLNKRTASSEVS